MPRTLVMRLTGASGMMQHDSEPCVGNGIAVQP